MSRIEPLEPRQLLAGVTILTHGNDGNITGWIKTATNAIVKRIGKDDTSTYVMKVTQTAKHTLGVTSFTLDGGPGLIKSQNAEAVVRLDWTDVDSGSYSTEAVGDVVASYLTVKHGTMPALASLPLQLVGHSRGASLMSVVAERLGEQGVWVDQTTFLDPHPVDGGIDNAFIDDGDPQVHVWDNVTFADDYWRDDGLNFDPDGESISGAHDSNLKNSVGKKSDGLAHNGVPAYYNGTIDTTLTDGGDENIYSSWYTGGNPARTATGYVFSRLGGTARPVDGLRAEFGGTASRRATTQTGSQWSNVDDLQVLNGTTYAVGQTIPLRLKQQDRDSAYTITMWLDRDKNPFNDNNARKISFKTFDESSTLTTTRINGSSSDIAPGTYYVYAKVSDSATHARYTYSRRITLTSPNTPITQAAAAQTAAAVPQKKVTSVAETLDL